MKGCILEANLHEQWWYLHCLPFTKEETREKECTEIEN